MLLRYCSLHSNTYELQMWPLQGKYLKIHLPVDKFATSIKQGRAEQSRAEQSRAEQSRAEQSRAQPNLT